MKHQSKMIGKDAAGQQVSLLNDEPPKQATPRQQDPKATDQRHGSLLSSAASSPIDDLSLTRRNSWGTSYGSNSPTTPMSAYEGQHGFYRSPQSSPSPAQQSIPYPQNAYGHGASQSGYQYPTNAGSTMYGQRSYPSSTTSSPVTQHSYPQGSFASPNHVGNHAHQEGRSTANGEGKRFPCRLAHEYNCDKTFTTSGHASRHSKIHTAEKGVQCTFASCDKKFTRSDNMKQHLETHKKEKRKSSENGVSKRTHNRSSGRSSRDSSLAARSKDLLSLTDARSMMMDVDSSRIARSMDLLALAAESHQPVQARK